MRTIRPAKADEATKRYRDARRSDPVRIDATGCTRPEPKLMGILSPAASVLRRRNQRHCNYSCKQKGVRRSQRLVQGGRGIPITPCSKKENQIGTIHCHFRTSRNSGVTELCGQQTSQAESDYILSAVRTASDIDERILSPNRQKLKVP